MRARRVWGQLTAPGTSRSTVRIVSRFLWWYRIEALEYTRLGRRRGDLQPGQRALIPRWKVQFVARFA